MSHRSLLLAAGFLAALGSSSSAQYRRPGDPPLPPDSTPPAHADRPGPATGILGAIGFGVGWTLGSHRDHSHKEWLPSHKYGALYGLAFALTGAEIGRGIDWSIRKIRQPPRSTSGRASTNTTTSRSLRRMGNQSG
jgi:hypothetical protein